MRTLTLIWLKIATRKITYIAYIKSFIKHNHYYQTFPEKALKEKKKYPEPLDLTGESPVGKGIAISCLSEHCGSPGDGPLGAYAANHAGRNALSDVK